MTEDGMKKLLCLLLVTAVIGSIFCACSASKEVYDFKKITSEEAKEKLDSGEYVFLDVRRDDEYAEGHIPGSINVAIDTSDVEIFKAAVVDALPSKDAKIVVYCKAGFRSDIAAKAMCTLGYVEIYDMTDGMDGWKYETEREG